MTVENVLSPAAAPPAAAPPGADSPTGAMTQAPGRPPARRGPRDELEVLIRARYPIIYVVTWEEARLEQHLQRLAHQRGKELFSWSVTSGVQRSGSLGAAARKGVADPLEALDTLLEHKQAAIYLFKDLHPFLCGPQANVAVVRKLREVARALGDSYKTLVICSPQLALAPDLEKDVTVLDYPLPGPVDFEVLLRRICDDVAATTRREVRLEPASREKLVQAALGLTLQEAENVFAKTIVHDGRLCLDDVSLVVAEKQQIVRKSGLLEFVEPSADLEMVGGLDLLKDWLSKRSRAFSERARQYGLPAPRGVLLVGVQGCGKSLCAKAVARLWGMPLLRFDVGRMFSSLVGSSEENIRRTIAMTESIAPVVLWVDEIDKSFAGSRGRESTDSGTSARVISTFLTWLNEKTAPVFVVATANDISGLPPELLRKGRLDEIFFLDLPAHGERRQIFAIHLDKRGREPERFDLDQLAVACEGFSGAEIEEAVISALYDSFYLDRELEQGDLLGALRETVPLSRTMAESIAALRQWADGRARLASFRELGAAGGPLRRLEIGE